MIHDERLISALQVAYRTNLHPATIYRKALRGEIPGLVRLGRTVRFRESDIEAWLKAQARPNDRRGDRGEHNGQR